MTNPQKKDDTLVALFEKSAGLHEERTAVIFMDGQKTSKLLYKDLIKQSDQISAVLQSHSIQRECVGICDQLSLHTIPVLIGIMKSNCCFCLMHLHHPKKYFCNIISRLEIKAFLAPDESVLRFSKLIDGQFVQYPLSFMPGVSVLIKSHCERSRGFDGLAYCITTSGTTGDPKIVKVPHQCIVSNITSIRQIYGLTPEDVVCQVAPLTFDPSIVEIFTSLSAGSSLLMTPDIFKKTPEIFRAIIDTHKATVLQGTPTLIGNLGLKFLLGEQSSLRVLSFGGEACPSLQVIMDNKHPNNATKLFNLYGITEVSSWATCCPITDEHLNNYKEIPLGSALEDTSLELRNEDNEIITSGTGFLFIGGHMRQCLINDEQDFDAKKMRNSGDLVKIDEKGDLYYLGRNDEQVKRMGMRVNLLELEKVTLKVKGVNGAVAMVTTDQKFIVIIEPSEKQSSENLIGEVHTTINNYLPSYYKPDEVLIYEAKLPFNRHGKVDKKKLQHFVGQTKINKSSRRSDLSQSLSDVLIEEWKMALNLVSSKDICLESQFLQMGGDSLTAVRLLDQMESRCNCILPGFLDILLSGTFCDLKCYLETKIPQLKRKREDGTHLNQLSKIKNRKVDSEIDLEKNPSSSDSSDFNSCQMLLCHKCESTQLNPGTILSVRRCARTQWFGKGSVHGLSHSIFSKAKWLERWESAETNSIHIKRDWTVNLGKCIDASPLAVKDSDSCTVYLGSHSHTFMAVDVNTGTILWRVTLGDRIESSAVLSKCTKYVIVGCYDGKLYVLDRKTGTIEWTFNTHGQVKCSPEIDPLTGLVFVGSHSHAVYGLHLEDKKMSWCQKNVGGSIYSSPFVCQNTHQLYVASLSGKLLCLKPDSGDIIWTHQLDKPIFSSPHADSNQVVVGCVDGTVFSFSHNGEQLWKHKTDAPVFSSPCLRMHGNTLCGSHDNCVYSLSNTGELMWKYETNSSVFSSPFVLSFCGIHVNKPSAVIVCDTHGTVYIINIKDGTLLSKIVLPGELFSSPIFVNNKIIVGCRNDYIFCLDLV